VQEPVGVEVEARGVSKSAISRTFIERTRQALGELMARRWTAAGMLEAERQFRRIVGYRQLAKLANPIERDLALSTTPKEVATLVPA
jgi:hypothetical protein